MQVQNVLKLDENVWVRKVNTIEGAKWEVVDDLFSPDAVESYETLSAAYEDALHFAFAKFV